MSRQTIPKALHFYYDLAETVRQEKQPLVWAETMVREAVQQHHVLPKTAEPLAEQACRVIGQSPYWGYILATLAHTAAQAGNNKVQAKCTLALARASNRLGLWKEAVGLWPAARQAFTQLKAYLTAAHCQVGLAIAYYQLNRNSKAIALCHNTLAVFKKAGDVAGIGQCALLLAGIYRAQGQYGEAERWARQARQQFTTKKLDMETGLTNLELAYIYACEQRFDESLSLLNITHKTFLSAGWMAEVAYGYVIRAWIHLDRSEYHQALPLLNAAQDIYRKENMAAALRECDLNIANAYRWLGREDEALSIYLRLRREFAGQGMTINVAKCNMNIGLTYKQQNRYLEALTCFQQAEQTCLKAGLMTHAARCQTNMAQVEELLGAYDRALEKHRQAGDIFTREGLLVNAAHCQENMARVCLTVQQFDRALALLQSARQTFQAANASLLVVDNQVYLAQVYQALGRYELACDMLEQAQTAYHAFEMSGRRALCLLRLGDLSLAQQKPARAANFYVQARREFFSRQWLVNVALCDLGLGETSLAQEHVGKARRYFSAVLPVVEPDFPEWVWRAHYGLARCFQHQGKYAKSLHHYMAAVNTIWRGRKGLYTAGGSSTFFASRQHVYNHALALALQTGETEKAVEIVEQSKAQIYLGMLNNSMAGGLYLQQAGGLPDDLLKQEQALRGRIELLQNFLSFPLDTKTAPYSHLLNQLTRANREYEEVMARLFRIHPFRASATHPPSFTLAGFRKAMSIYWPEPWGALTYYLSESQLTIQYLDAETTMGWTKELTPFEEKLLHICTSSYQTRRQAVLQETPSGDESNLSKKESAFLGRLYPLLIPPEVQKRLSPERLLIIVPHNILHALPFHALPSSPGKYLVQQTTVVYAPSLHIFQLLLTRSGAAAKSKKEKTRALIIGVSKFKQPSPPLPAVRAEAQAVKGLLGTSSTLLLDEQANYSTLLAMNERGALKNYRLVHFATHTLFAEDAPLLSRLLLYDGALTTSDLFNFSLDAELVTLSSCEGARSNINVGDEMMGLAQAVFTAGAKALIAGLWKVPDETTSMLMVKFYRAMQTGQIAARALRTAQLQMIAAGYTPFHWSPFVLLGHPGAGFS